MSQVVFYLNFSFLRGKIFFSSYKKKPAAVIIIIIVRKCKKNFIVCVSPQFFLFSFFSDKKVQKRFFWCFLKTPVHAFAFVCLPFLIPSYFARSIKDAFLIIQTNSLNMCVSPYMNESNLSFIKEYKWGKKSRKSANLFSKELL